MGDVSFFKKISIFSDLTDKEIGKIVGIVKEVAFPKGSSVIQEGERGVSMYVLGDGSVEVSKTLAMKIGNEGFEEKEKILQKLKAGDHAVFGEVVLLEDDIRTASVTAVTDCTLWEIQRDDFEHLAEEDPRLGFKVVRNIARLVCTRLRKADEDTVKLTTALSIALST